MQNSTDIVTLDGRVTTVEGDITDLDDAITEIAGDTSTTYTDANGDGIRHARTNEAGLAEIDAFAQGGATALGYQAAVTGADAVALGRDTRASIMGRVVTRANCSVVFERDHSYGWNNAMDMTSAVTQEMDSLIQSVALQ